MKFQCEACGIPDSIACEIPKQKPEDEPLFIWSCPRHAEAYGYCPECGTFAAGEIDLSADPPRRCKSCRETVEINFHEM